MFSIELLESRDTPASVFLDTSGVLAIIGDAGGSNIVVNNPNPNVVEVQVFDEGVSYDYDAAQVKNIFFQGNGLFGDMFVNNTTINSLQKANGMGTNYLQGGNGTDVLIGSEQKSNNILFDSAGNNNMFVGGAGRNNIQSFGGSDTIFAGSGDNLIYAILGNNTIFGLNGDGAILTNGTSKVFANYNQEVVRFFQKDLANQTVVLQRDENGNGILYLNPQTQGVGFVINEISDSLVVTYFESGNFINNFIFNKNDVKWIASFGSSGKDVYVNNTTANVVQYGAGNDDLLVGGYSKNLLKGSGGNDVLIGRGAFDDLSANTGSDLLIGSGKETVFRTDSTGPNTKVLGFDGSDLIFGPIKVN